VSFEDSLEELRREFAAGLPRRLADLTAAWQGVEAAGWDGDAGRLLHRLAHSLAGAAGTFGYPRVGDIARRLERLVKPPVAAEAGPAVPPLLAELRREIAG
jgi:periplasmic divalent cation tolerance protein